MNRWFRTSSCRYIFALAICAYISIGSCASVLAQEVSDDFVEIEGAIVKIIDSANIPAEVQGVLLEITFREGQEVRKGDVLAKIKSKDSSLELKRANAKHRISKAKAENRIDVEYAKKTAQVSSAKLGRSQNSNQRAPGAVSRGRLQELELEAHRDKLRIEQATRDLEVARMELELAQTDVELSEHSIEKMNIRSPINGSVVLVEKNVGEWVEPGDTVLKIVRLDRLRLKGFVPAAVAGRIKVNDNTKVVFEQQWLAKKKVEGRVAFLNPEANPVNSQVEVWIEIDNPNRKLMPGLEATIIIDFQHKTSKSLTAKER